MSITKYVVQYGLDETAEFTDQEQATIFTMGLVALGKSYSMYKETK